MADRKFSLEVNNIGPLHNLQYSKKSNNLQTVLFATNGSGKTFIGRCFNLLSEIQQNIKPSNLESLLNFDAKEAEFLFDYSDPAKNNKFYFKINEDGIIEHKLESDFIIHVFNKEFVDKNVSRNNYAIDSSSISGEILIGDETIDVAKDEQELNVLKGNKEKLVNTIKNELEQCKAVVSKLGIRSSLYEYGQMTYENLLTKDSYDGISFSKAKDNYSIIKNIPENLDKIPLIGYTLDEGIFKDIELAIGKVVNLSTIGEDFKQKILNKSAFVKNGLQLIGNNRSKCPFCEGSLEDKQDLIDKYIEYFNQEEAKFDEELDKLMIRLQGFENDINGVEKDYNKCKLLFCEQKKYFRDLQDVDFLNISNMDDLKDAIRQIDKLLKEKVQNKTKTVFNIDFTLQKSMVINFLESLEQLKSNMNNYIGQIEKKKSDISAEQTSSRREVCTAAFGELYNSQMQNITQLKVIIADIEKKQKEINTKKSINKKNKKDKVNETFEKYLKEFFNDKYTFNKEKQCLSLDKHLLKNNAENVLSEGEKNIIGFCYYLALVYNRINAKQDCANLLFVIDDPISSMDYHYVYKVTDIIRNLRKELGSEWSRYIILTHNYEFLNLLMKNNISTLNIILTNGKISEISDKIILPYTEHLKFIYDVANGSDVTFQTPNSMRHVLETICHFSYPDIMLKDFINDNDVLSTSEYLFTAINDLSHGAIRMQKPYTDDDIRDGCVKIIDYINKYYPGQLTKFVLQQV